MRGRLEALRLHLRRGGGAVACLTLLAGCGAQTTAPKPHAETSQVPCRSTAEVALAVGEARLLRGTEAECIRLHPAAGARYVLSVTHPEAGIRGDTARASLEITLHNRMGRLLPLMSRSASEEISPFTEADALWAGAPAPEAADPFKRDRPWAVGERFPVLRPYGGEAAALVLDVQPNGLVLALVEADRDKATERHIQQLRRALRSIATDGLSYLESAYGVRLPVTSAGSGQTLLLLSAWDASRSHANMMGARDPASGRGLCRINLNLSVSAESQAGWAFYDTDGYRHYVLGHEISHCLQMGYAEQAQREGKQVSWSERWSSEGGATLGGLELVRRHHGIPAYQNWDWEKGYRDSDQRAYTHDVLYGSGDLQSGYHPASLFLRHLTQQLAGGRAEMRDAALSGVLRGAVDGWRGLSALAHTEIAADWTPQRAMLEWAAAHAVDELHGGSIPSVLDFRRANAERGGWGRIASLDLKGTGAVELSLPGAGVAAVRLEGAGLGGVIGFDALPAAALLLITRY